MLAAMRMRNPARNPLAARWGRDLLAVLELLGKIDAGGIGLRSESSGGADPIDTTRAGG